VLRKALSQILRNQYGVQILGEHHLKGKMSQWPVIIVPGWTYLEPKFRDELAVYAKSGGRLLLIEPGPVKLFETELKQSDNNTIVSIDAVDDVFGSVLKKALPEPIVEVEGSTDVDISPRMLNGKLSIHLVNTSGPHANAPDGGIKEIKPVGPLMVTVRLAKAPTSIIQQPQNKPLKITWANGRAAVMLPRLEVYSILEVER
jgi:hypothetical protein